MKSRKVVVVVLLLLRRLGPKHRPWMHCSL